MVLKKGVHLQSWAPHDSIPAELYIIKGCVMENTEKGYTGRNIYILFDSQAAVKSLDSFQINPY
jgi:hypothetical protein